MEQSVENLFRKGWPGKLNILFEDNHCLVVNKPAGMATTHASGSELTVDRLAKAYLKEKFAKPGRVFLGIVHRLDKPVSGVLLFARTSKAAARLAYQFRERAVNKVYWAVVTRRRSVHDSDQDLCGIDGDFTMTDWLLHDDAATMVRTMAMAVPGASLAKTVGRVLSRDGEMMLLELRPQTGRKHQLRVQLTSRGWPIVGDGKYGSPIAFPEGIALHAVQLTFRHPVRDELIRIPAPPPAEWNTHFPRLLRQVAIP